MKKGSGSEPNIPNSTPEGRCKRCRRKLTNPDSLERGYGPVCWGKVHVVNIFENQQKVKDWIGDKNGEYNRRESKGRISTSQTDKV